MLDFLLSIPVLVKITVSLAVIIFVNKLLSNQILGILAGTVVLAFWIGHSFLSVISISWNRFSETDNLFLLLVILIIIALSSQMKSSGLMEDLVKNINSKFSRNKSIAILPAVIGLLPMPGGALFSAPLVDSCDPEKRIDPLLKTRINYWFRHIWEYWWPLYPGVLLAIDISGLSVPVYMAVLFPVTVVSVIGAWFLLIRKAGKDEGIKYNVAGKSNHGILFLLSPILIIIGIYAFILTFLPFVSEVSKYLPMAIGIIASIVYLQLIKPINWDGWKRIILSKNIINMILLVALIRIYGAFIEGRLSNGTLLMEVLGRELTEIGISPYVLIMLIPFLCGISTGIAIGTVGAAFPIVISLIGADPGFNLLVSTTVLAYTFGHAGQLLSPVHVCLLVSNEYFSVGLGKSLMGLIKPALLILLTGFLLSRLYLGIL